MDIDNTLLDFDAYVKCSLRDGFKKFGLGVFNDHVLDTFHRVNNKLWLDIEHASLDLEGLKQIRFNLIFKELGITFDGVRFETFFREELNESAIPVDGAYALLEKLSGRYILAAASNGPSLQQRHRLELASMDKYLDFIFASEDFGVSKPSADFFDRCFQLVRSKTGAIITPEQAVMIGDSITADISGAVSYGMRTCFFNKYKRDISGDVMPDCQFDSLEEMSLIF